MDSEGRDELGWGTGAGGVGKQRGARLYEGLEEQDEEEGAQHQPRVQAHLEESTAEMPSSMKMAVSRSWLESSWCT